MTDFQVEKVADILDEIKPLLFSHWEEIALYRDQFPLNPDFGKYLSLEAVGMTHVVTARNAGELIGYCICFIMPHLHYQDCIVALNDILFLKKEFRKGLTGVRMIRFAEHDLTRIGVNRMILHVKTSHDFGSLLERRGFTWTEKTYEKLLNGRIC